MKRFAIPLLFVASAARADDAPRAGAAPRTLTFQGAIALALGDNPEIALARESVAGAEAHAAGVKARRYASLHLELAGNFFREAYQLPFGAETVTLHERETSATSVTLSQPLTRLAYLSAVVGAAQHETAAIRGEYERVRLETAYRTAEAYLRVLSARASGEVAHRSVADLQRGLDRAIQLRQAETYTDIDVLRLRAAKAAAEQVALRADTAAQNAQASLVVQLGLADGTPVELADDLPAEPPPLQVPLDQAQARALAARPELRAARAKIATASSARRAARAQYLPDVRAVAVWEHVTGVQPFQPENSEFLGLRLSWNVWDWGATHHAVVEAEHAAARATVAAGAAAEQVRLEVRKRWHEAKTLYESLAVARTQQQTAEEAYRLQQVRFDNAAATVTDVLDAETEAARARLGVAVARFDYYLALFALARAVGDLPGLTGS